jgi:uncharacterized glyoxalase superfamily protein PhnB
MNIARKAGSPGASYIPEGLSTVTPYFIIKDIKGFIEFLKSAFDAEPVYAIEAPDGSIGHSEVNIGTSKIMVGGAKNRAEIPAFMYLYVPDVDAVFQKALSAGADLVQEPTRMYYGDYVATVRDPFGNLWSIASHVEDMSHEELNRLARDMWAGRKI